MARNVEICCVFALAFALSGCAKEASAPPVASAEQEDLVSLENRAVGLMGQFKYDQAVANYEQIAKRANLTDAQQQQFRSNCLHLHRLACCNGRLMQRAIGKQSQSPTEPS
ncbi:hypothetical protein OAS39_05830 [Pirellulales bacterium]|nr:hypothetical protein [Pirellulales bacterium]